MGGPYDIQGNAQEERSASHGLPFGLGGDGLMAFAAPMALYAGGSLAFRYGIKKGMGGKLFGGPSGFGLGYTTAEAKAAKAVEAVAKLGGSPQDTTRRIAGALYGNRVSVASQGASQYKGVYQARVKLGSAAPGHPVPIIKKTGRWIKKVTTSQPGLNVVGRVKTLNPNRPYVKNYLAGVATNAGKYAKVAQWGRAGIGWGVGVMAWQLGAMAIDIGKSVGEAAVDWRPRRSAPAPQQFGDKYTETMGAYTQRQRAINAIHDSQLSSRCAIGNEASFCHQ